MSDLDIFKTQNFGSRLGFGKKSALLIIDFQVGFSKSDVLGGYNINDAIAMVGLQGCRYTVYYRLYNKWMCESQCQ